MAKGKDVRVKVILECTGCVRKSGNKDQGTFPDILPKKIDTMRLVNWNCETSIPIVSNIQFMES